MLPILYGVMAAELSITLSGGDGGLVSRVDAVSPYNTIVGIRFLTNGNIETGKAVNGGAIVWSPWGTWISPTSEASTDYDARFTNFNGAGGGDWSNGDDYWCRYGSVLSKLKKWVKG